jgi:hypothetical protein
MPDGHQLPKQRNMRNHNHDDPFDREAERVSELNSLQRNPYEPVGDNGEIITISAEGLRARLQDAWRDGWHERKRWDQERDAQIVRKRGRDE